MIRKGTPDLSTGKEINAEFYKCKKCGHEYYDTWKYCPNCRTPKDKGGILTPLITILLFIIIVFACLYIYPKTHNKIEQADNKNIAANKIINELEQIQKSQEEIIKQINTIPIKTPPTGIYQLYTADQFVAPFQIINHKDNKIYLLKFTNIENETTAFTIFLNKNENLDIKVPLGIYEISYASGDTWYGDIELFGTSTNYQKYDETYNFYINSQGYQGYYIDMEPQINGNLKSSYINKDEF